MMSMWEMGEKFFPASLGRVVEKERSKQTA